MPSVFFDTHAVPNVSLCCGSANTFPSSSFLLISSAVLSRSFLIKILGQTIWKASLATLIPRISCFWPLFGRNAQILRRGGGLNNQGWGEKEWTFRKGIIGLHLVFRFRYVTYVSQCHPRNIQCKLKQEKAYFLVRCEPCDPEFDKTYLEKYLINVSL